MMPTRRLKLSLALVALAALIPTLFPVWTAPIPAAPERRFILTPPTQGRLEAGRALIESLGLALLAAAAALLWSATWPSPQGGRCRRCNYDLFGIRGDNCPECGEPINP